MVKAKLRQQTFGARFQRANIAGKYERNLIGISEAASGKLRQIETGAKRNSQGESRALQGRRNIQ
jgi:hypothetical protein